MNDFFNDLRQEEEYATLSVNIDLLNAIRLNYLLERDYKLHSIKQKNDSHYKDEILTDLYKQKRKIANKISEREQELNHNK